MTDTQGKEHLTDIVTDKKSQTKHKTGKNSRKVRTDNFRLEKNQKTADSILSGIFARLKISDPTTVSSAPLAKEVHPVVAPIGIKTMPQYIDRVWDTMEAIGTRPFSQLNNPGTKATFTKGAMILAEAKLSYAQRRTDTQGKEHLTDIVTDKKSQTKHKTGKNSRKVRTDNFRLEKNQKTADSILSGIFARLKISDPTTVSSAPLAKEVHPVVAPIGIKTMPQYIDRVWDTMEAIGTRPFSQLNNPGTKATFTKGAMILALLRGSVFRLCRF